MNHMSGHLKDQSPRNDEGTKLDFNETYYFLRMYSIDLNTARQAIKVLKRYRRPDVRYALLRDLIVTYVRPFSTNIGPKSKHHLGVKAHVPKGSKELHKELVRVRMEQFAHTDLRYYTPTATAFRGPQGEHYGYGMMFKSYDYEALLRRLPEIEALVFAVESSVNAAINEAHANYGPPIVPIPPPSRSLENLTEKSE